MNHRTTAAVFLAASLGAPGLAAQGEDPARGPEASGRPLAAAEDRTAEAARRFEQGLSFYGTGEYRLAVIEFERAYELVPDYRVLYNIGQVCMQLGQYARARRALERYLAQGADEVPGERVSQVRDDLDMLGQRTGHITVLVSLAGAEVLVDDERVGVAPLAEPLLVEAGRHAVTARFGGSSATPELVTVAGGDSISVAIEIVPRQVEQPPGEPEVAPLPVASPPPPPVRDQPMVHLPYWWVGWVATGGLAAGAAVTFALGDAAARDHQRLEERATTEDEWEDSERRAVRLLDTSTGLTVGAAVSGGVSAYFTVRRFRKHRATPDFGGQSAGGESRRGSSTTVVAGPTGVAVLGRF
ncbi:MAG: tetratricopeptide repeat protein [Polyangiaceae bacterium]|nr:tetratricopeptide repeat protein [Polyangiaceae bacterium]